MPKLIVEIDYGDRDWIARNFDEHEEIIEEALNEELESNYDPPEKPPKYTYKRIE